MIQVRMIIVLFCFLGIISSCKEQPAPAVKAPADSTKVHQGENTNNPYTPVDVSPMDMCYFPDNYPQLKMAGKAAGGPVMRVIYSRPHLQGRKLFHDILKYDQPWRLGANEATELDVYKPVSVNGKKLKEGRYTMYCIPSEGQWTIAINSNLDIWGLKSDSTKDIVRAVISTSHNNPRLEYFTMIFKETPTGADLIMWWDDTLAKLPFTF